MKKALTLLLALLLVFASVPAGAEQPGMARLEPVPQVQDTIGLQAGTQLVVGSPTQMNGYFSTDLWGNNTADMDVRALLHGYATVVWVQDRGVVLDGTVVKNLASTQNPDGTRSYTFTIADGLMYNDGTPIDARDYAFSLLLSSAPEVGQLGGTPRGLDFLAGYDAYRTGSKKFSGVRLLDNRRLSLTITAEYQPYFYGLALMSVSPYPISAIAPGCEVKDDGDGAYIGASGSVGKLQAADGYTPGVFSKEMLQVTMLDPANGYAFSPFVTSGPYELVSNDRNAHEARFRVNPNYKGNYEGQKPHIENLVFKQVKTEHIAAALADGSVDLVNKVANEGPLKQAEQQIASGQLRKDDYSRTGLTYLSFVCDRGPTASVAVRQAIARCVDKSALATQILGAGRAMPVHGYYGMGQWMTSFQIRDGSGQTMSAASAMERYATGLDLDSARKLLEQDGWTLNERGGPFVLGQDVTRYRTQDNQLQPLVIRWAKSVDNPAADLVEQALRGPFSQLGIELETTTMPFAMLLRQYYSADQQSYDMFFMGSNFTYLFDPYYDYSDAPECLGLINSTRLKDDQLVALAHDLRRTEPGNADQYIQKWFDFQARWVMDMPMVPLYSNVYADLYRADLQDYNINQRSSWALAIPYAHLTETDAMN